MNMQVGLRHRPYELALVGTNITNSKTPIAVADTNDAFISNKENVILSPPTSRIMASGCISRCSLLHA